MKIKLIVFDFDGTLIDTREDIAAAMNYALKKCGLTPVSTETVWKYTGDGTPPLVQRILRDKQHLELFEQVKSLFLEYYDAHFADFAKPLPNVKETIAHLSEKGKKMAILSNKYERFVKKLLKEFDMDGFFFAIYGKDSFEKSKPDPYPLFKIMEMANSSVNETAFVGDSKNDALISKNAGVECFIIPSGVNPEEELRRLYKCKILDNISELEKYVE